MSERSRRWLLGATGTAMVAMAGCTEDTGNDEDGGADDSGPSGDGDSGPSGEDDSMQNEPEPRTVVDETVRVSEDGYQYFNIPLQSEAELELRTTVRSGPAVDIILMSQDEFNQFQAENRFRYNSDLSQMDTTGDVTSFTAPAADLVLVVDNSSAGEAQPPSNFDDDVARVEVTLTATPV